MRAALDTLDLARLWIIHPGEHAYRMTENMPLSPAGTLL
jgi:hypothetical protein